MGEEQVLANERMAEPETSPDDLTGRVHYGLHLAPQDARMASASIRVLHTRRADRRGKTLPHQPQ